MQTPAMMDVILTDQEHDILNEFNTSQEKYMAGEGTQKFVLIISTDQEDKKARELANVLDKLDKATGKEGQNLVRVETSKSITI